MVLESVLLNWLSSPFMPLKYSQDSRQIHRGLEKMIQRAKPCLISLPETEFKTHIFPLLYEWNGNVISLETGPQLSSGCHGLWPCMAKWLTTQQCSSGREVASTVQGIETKLILCWWQKKFLGGVLHYYSPQSNILQNYCSTPEASESCILRKKPKIVKDGPLAHLTDKLLAHTYFRSCFKNDLNAGYHRLPMFSERAHHTHCHSRCKDK